MKKRSLLTQSVQLCTGKYGILLLTMLNAALACLVTVLSNQWQYLGCTMTNKDFITFYLLDYRVGFVSRALIGSILYLFTKHPTVRMVSILLTVMVILSLLLFAFFQAQIAKKTLERSDHGTLLLSYLFYVNAIFWCNAFVYIGLTDIFMILLMQLFLLCAERKLSLAYFLSPIICAVGLLIHTSFLFVGFVVVGAILWFDLLRRGKPDGVRIALFAAACIVSVVLFVLFVFFTQEMVRVNLNEMLDLVHEKYDGWINEEYYTVYLFQTSDAHPEIAKKHFLQFILEYHKAGNESSNVLRYLLDILPLTAAFFAGCVFHARLSGNRKIAYLGCLAPFVALFPALSVSTDKDRFFSLFILAQYMVMHYLVMRTDSFFLPCLACPPLRKLSHYETVRREERLRHALRCGAVAGLIFTLVGYRML